jgi:DNA-binding LacI/PurR family transcriptional regulator
LVLINRNDDQEGPLSINLNDAEAAGRILTAFVRAGCRRLAFANSGAMTPSLMAREHGFVAAAGAIGMEVTIARHGPSVYHSGRVLAHQLITGKDRPDAVFCANDLIACGFMDAARHDFSISVPDQLCIAGFDDIEQASWTSYDLTTFAQPVEPIADNAVEWLTKAAESPQGVQRLILNAELVWRSSIRGG